MRLLAARLLFRRRRRGLAGWNLGSGSQRILEGQRDHELVTVPSVAPGPVPIGCSNAFKVPARLPLLSTIGLITALAPITSRCKTPVYRHEMTRGHVFDARSVLRVLLGIVGIAAIGFSAEWASGVVEAFQPDFNEHGEPPAGYRWRIAVLGFLGILATLVAAFCAFAYVRTTVRKWITPVVLGTLSASFSSCFG